MLTLEEKGEKRNAEGKDYNEINIEEMVNEISNQSNNTTMQDWKLKKKKKKKSSYEENGDKRKALLKSKKENIMTKVKTC